ncbi:cytochrome c oxidase assembly protein [Cypionkella sp.]|jgi:cytochrome c oxidase assembly protein subunit 11|uniref:cytochrome c oxidase assembly protein n=1 Tax=Cypionkella sp. TaxID=2811411 RepID=UPI0027287ECE|nr:cytochrome c oxidase assembly protein [Cypionkella sp.]MDO8982960.1 cytochrome c oxidase assembly protein [Cypionkella sp.]MDP2047645.1 cytochrome c oxidase assembly protein [Cypionkella sp.]
MSKSVAAQKKTAAMLAGVAVVMLSLSFAAVPFYNWFCRVTGYAGTTSVAATGADEVLEQTVKIRFDASLEAGMPWEFRAVQPSMTIRIGETGLAFYEAYNPTDKAVGGQASYNVTPDQSGGYFTKIECFCFTEQILQPGERVQMPVSFYVDPSIVKDPEASLIKEITLSYTFHVADIPQKQAANTVAPALAETPVKLIE